MKRAIYIIALCCSCVTVCLSQRNPDLEDLKDWSYGEKKNDWKGTNPNLPADMPFDKEGNLIYLGILKSGGTKSEQVEKIKKFFTDNYAVPSSASSPPKGSTTYQRRDSEIMVDETENTVTCKILYLNVEGFFHGISVYYTLRFYLKRDKCKYELIVSEIVGHSPAEYFVGSKKSDKWAKDAMQKHFEAMHVIFSEVIQNLEKPKPKKDDW